MHNVGAGGKPNMHAQGYIQVATNAVAALKTRLSGEASLTLHPPGRH